MTDRTCITCAAPIGPKSTGRCRPCATRLMNQDRDIVVKRSATNAAHFQRPEHRARHAAAVAAGKQRRIAADPAYHEQLRAAGRELGTLGAEYSRRPEVRARAAASIRLKALAWCPERYWPLNAELKRAGLRLADRQRIVADEVARDERRRVEALTPLERQLERLRNGARLIAKPDFRRPDPAYTLGGVAPEAM